MYIPIRRWEFETAAYVIRDNLRTDQAANRVTLLGNIMRGTAWLVAEKLSGEKLPR